MAVWDNVQCPKRGPGLSHIQGVDLTCEHCGEVTFRADRAYLLGLFRIRPVVDQEPVVPEDTESLASECGCWDCTHPNHQNVDIRALHTLRHRDFDAYVAERDAGRLAQLGLTA